jgi:hypothetical protein
MRKEFLTDEEAPEGYTPKPTPKSRVLPPRPEDLARMKEPAPEVVVYTNRADVPEGLRGHVPPEPERLGRIPPSEMARVLEARFAAREEKSKKKALEELESPRRKRVLKELHDIYNQRHGKVPVAEEVESESEESKQAGPKGKGSAKRVRVDDEGATPAKG